MPWRAGMCCSSPTFDNCERATMAPGIRGERRSSEVLQHQTISPEAHLVTPPGTILNDNVPSHVQSFTQITASAERLVRTRAGNTILKQVVELEHNFRSVRCFDLF